MIVIHDKQFCDAKFGPANPSGCRRKWPPYRRPKKLKIAKTTTTAPTSQMILFMISLLLLSKVRAWQRRSFGTTLLRVLQACP